MAKKEDDLGQAEAQKLADEATAQGFIGTKVDPRDNSEHSLESGPESPSALEQHAAALEQRAADLRSGSAQGA